MPTDNVIGESADYRGAGSTMERNKRITRNYGQLDKQYEVWKAAYIDVADYIALGRGRFIDRGELPNQKSKAASKVINNTPSDALHMLGAGLHGGLSSPARPWFQLNFVDPEMNEWAVYREWLDDCEKAMYAAFKRSNFYTIVHSVYEEIGAFGTGSMFCDESEISPGNRDLLFHAFTAGDYRFSVRPDGRTGPWYRNFKMQAIEVAQDFGPENCSDKIHRLLKNNPYEWVEIYHCVEPNGSYDPEKWDNKPFRSVYFEAKEGDRRLSDNGYHEHPVVTPRWQALSNEAYGWGPGLESVGLAKAIQRMEKQSFMASDKALDPPMGVPASLKDRMLDLGPGGRNVYEESEGKFQRLVEIDMRALQYYDLKVKELESKVRRNFFNELFLMIADAGQTMTATEVMARQEEKMLMIGPTIERLLYEFLDPIVTRVFNVLWRNGALPPAPPELAQAEYKVDYVSILAQAQKLVNSQSMQTYLGIAERVALVDPSSVVKTDWDQYLEEMGNTVSLPAKVVRSDDDVDEIRNAQAEQQAKMEQAAIMAQGVQNAKTLSETDTAGDNALTEMAAEQ